MSRRIRTLKPELLEDEMVAGLTGDAFRLFIGCILLADDYGNLRGTVEYLHGQIFWRRREANVAAALAELLADTPGVPLLVSYQVRGQCYLRISGWDKHQKVDRPGRPKVPAPSLTDDETHTPAKIREDSRKFAALSRKISPRAGPGPRSLDLDVGVSAQGVLKDPEDVRPSSSPATVESTTRVRGRGNGTRKVRYSTSQKPDVPARPEWLSAEAWGAWLEFRKRTRAPFTVHAQTLSLRKLEALRAEGHDPVAVIEQSIERGWTGLFAVRTDSQQRMRLGGTKWRGYLEPSAGEVETNLEPEPEKREEDK